MRPRRLPTVPVPTGLLLLLVAGLLTACSPQTAGTPADGYELTARFETVDNLVVGHDVRLSDVEVGTVVGVELDGYQALVTMVVDRAVDLPRDTVATIRRTSLMGEDYVALERPGEPGAGTLADGDELATGPGQAGLEEVALQGLRLVEAVSAEDAVALVEALQEMVGGREEQLATLIEDAGAVTGEYADHRGELEDALDGMASLGRELDEASPDVEALVDDLDGAVEVLSRQRERMLASLEALPRLQEAAQGSVLGETRAELEQALDELGPVIDDLAGDEERFHELVDNVVLFAERLQEAIHNDEIDLYGLMMLGIGDTEAGVGSLVEELLELVR